MKMSNEAEVIRAIEFYTQHGGEKLFVYKTYFKDIVDKRTFNYWWDYFSKNGKAGSKMDRTQDGCITPKGERKVLAGEMTLTQTHGNIIGPIISALNAEGFDTIETPLLERQGTIQVRVDIYRKY